MLPPVIRRGCPEKVSQRRHALGRQQRVKKGRPGVQQAYQLPNSNGRKIGRPQPQIIPLVNRQSRGPETVFVAQKLVLLPQVTDVVVSRSLFIFDQKTCLPKKQGFELPLVVPMAAQHGQRHGFGEAGQRLAVFLETESGA